MVVKADITTPQEETVELHRDSARRVLLSMKQSEIRQHWCGLRLQGKLACLGFADHSVSHSVFKNAAVGEDVLTFTIKARLQVLSTWDPHMHTPSCVNHQDSQQRLESTGGEGGAVCSPKEKVVLCVPLRRRRCCVFP